MNEYIEALRRYVTDHPPNYGDGDCQSILDMLYYRYSECNRMDGAKIHEAFEELYRQMHGMPLRDMDRIIDVVCTLCREHEQSGFVTGVKTGFQLGGELK